MAACVFDFHFVSGHVVEILCPIMQHISDFVKYNGDFYTYYCETSEKNLKQRIRNYIDVYDLLESEQ